MQPQIEKVMTSAEHKIQKIADKAQFKLQAFAVKERAKMLPRWRKLFLQLYPEFELRSNYRRLDNVLAGRTADLGLLAKIIEVLNEVEHPHKQEAA